MKIIDAQVHDVGPWWDWTGERPELQHRIIGEATIAYLDALGIDAVVLFPGGQDEHAAWLSAELPDRFAYVPHISPDDADIDGAVQSARQSPGIVGLRALIGWPKDGTEVRRLESGAWDPVFAACERHRMPLFLFITGWLPKAADIAARYPGLPLIIDHLGLRQPPLDEPDDPAFDKLPQLLDLARFANVHVKLCGMPSMSKERFPFRDANAPLRAIVDAFGADRLMWASDTTRFVGRIGIGRYQNPRALEDYPGKHSYAESLLFIRENEGLTAAEKETILGTTAQRVLNWS